MRHGEVENPAGLRYGHLPGFHLSRRGRAQVWTAADHLARLSRPIAGVIASPLERATETASIVADGLGLGAVIVDDRLTEAPSAFDGLKRTAFLLPQHWPKLLHPFEPSWGEHFTDVARRMVAAIHDARTAHPGAALVLVSHQSPIWIAREAFASRRPPWMSMRRCTQASITTLRFDGPRYIATSYWAP
jgi:broad specificity phosphatase PhoE